MTSKSNHHRAVVRDVSLRCLPLRLLGVIAGVIACASAHGENADALVLPFKSVTIGSPVQDIIREVKVEEGQSVQTGQVLAQLRCEKEELEVARYEKLIEKAKFDSDAAQTLFREKMGTREKAVEKRSELDRLNIEHQLAILQVRERAITAPLSGIVVKKYKEAGESVDRVEKMFDVVNIDQVYVQFFLDARFFARFQAGAELTVRFPTLDVAAERRAKVTFIDPRIDASSGLFRIKLLLDNPDHRIKAGMRAQVILGE